MAKGEGKLNGRSITSEVLKPEKKKEEKGIFSLV